VGHVALWYFFAGSPLSSLHSGANNRGNDCDIIDTLTLDTLSALPAFWKSARSRKSAADRSPPDTLGPPLKIEFVHLLTGVDQETFQRDQTDQLSQVTNHPACAPPEKS
jgi:hypothetical protein